MRRPCCVVCRSVADKGSVSDASPSGIYVSLTVLSDDYSWDPFLCDRSVSTSIFEGRFDQLMSSSTSTHPLLPLFHIPLITRTLISTVLHVGVFFLSSVTTFLIGIAATTTVLMEDDSCWAGH